MVALTIMSLLKFKTLNLAESMIIRYPYTTAKSKDVAPRFVMFVKGNILSLVQPFFPYTLKKISFFELIEIKMKHL